MTSPLREVLRAVMLGDPNGSRKAHENEFIERMKFDRAYTEMLARDYFERMAAVYAVREDGHNVHTFGRTGVSIDKGQRMSAALTTPRTPALVRRTKEETAERSAAALAEIRASLPTITLLDLVLPNGKALRDCTGAECIKAGGFYEAVGKAIKGSQVVDKQLTEADLQNIKARFFQANVLDRDSKRSGDKRKRA